MRPVLGLTAGLALLAAGAAMAEAPAKDLDSLDHPHGTPVAAPWRAEFAQRDQSVVEAQRVEPMDEHGDSVDADRSELIAFTLDQAGREAPAFEPPTASELLIHVGETLVPPEATDPNASDRFWRWLRDLLGVPDEDQRQSTLDGWFAGWPGLSHDDQQRLQQALAVLVLGIAALLIVRELKASGWLGNGVVQRRQHRLDLAIAPMAGDANDWRAAPPIERAPLLFNQVIAALSKRSARSDAPALTNRERSRRYAAEAGASAPALIDLARLADQSIYARRAADPEQLQRLSAALSPSAETSDR